MEFREMRRKDRQLSLDRALEILRSQDWGILSVIGDNGYPYGVPVNYGYADGKLYIHCTSEYSHKADAIRRRSKVCMTVVSRHEMVEEELTSYFTSVVVFGTAKLIAEDGEKRLAMEKLAVSLFPSVPRSAVDKCSHMRNILMIEITPEHITGKEKR